MATKSLGQLTLDLVARTGGFVQGMSAAQRSSKKWRRQVEKDLKKVGKTFAAAAVAAAGSLTVLTKQGLDFVDSQAKTAARLGSTIDDLRALQIAASDFGIEQGQLESSLASFTKRLGDAARGTGEAQKAYEALGIEARELAQMPLAEQLALVAERIAEVDSAAERTSIADRLMSGGRNMVNLFEEGGGAIRAAVQEVDEFGLSLSEIDAARVEAANDAMGRIGRSTEGVRTQIAVHLAPALETIADLFNEAAKESQGFADTGEDIADKVVSSVGFVVDSVEGLKRTFELAGASLALYALQGQRAMMKLGEAIVDQPVKSINLLIEGLNKISPIDIEPVGITQLSQDLDRELALIEGAIAEGKEDIKRILMEPMPSAVFGDALERNQRLQEGRDAGLGDTISNDAIAAAEAVADAMSRASEAANDSADADEDKADKSDTAAKAIEDLGNASDGASRALASIAGGMAGSADPRYNIKAGGDTIEERARARFEASAFRPGDPSVINYAPNPTARPTWSTDYLDAGAQKVNQAVSQVASGQGGTGGKHLGTLALSSEQGGTIDVQANADALERWLADTLSGASASVSPV